jgi:hypothetical protein
VKNIVLFVHICDTNPSMKDIASFAAPPPGQENYATPAPNLFDGFCIGKLKKLYILMRHRICNTNIDKMKKRE